MPDDNTYRLTPCPCPPFWVSTRNYTFRCPEGTTGETITVSATARSNKSQQHADQLALEEAKRLAHCQGDGRYEQTACVLTSCVTMLGVVEDSDEDNES